MPESGPYEIAGLPKRPPPRLPGAVVLRHDEDTLIDAALADLYMHALACIKEFGSFQLAVSASPRVEALFIRMMIDPGLREFPWARTHLWLADESLPASSSPARFELLADLLATPSGIPADQVHGKALSHSGPAAYESELRDVLGWREKGHDRLDYILLPLALDGSVGVHPPVIADPLDTQPLIIESGDHLTMSPRLIRASRMVALWALGEPVAPRLRALERMHAGAEPGAESQSALAIEPHGGDMRWYIDSDACS